MLKSYGVDVEGKLIFEVVEEVCVVIFEKYKVFMVVLFCLYEIEIYFFVYVGICLGVVFINQVEFDFMWICGEFLNDICDYEKLVVYGYMVVNFFEYVGNCVNLDGGIGFGWLFYFGVFEGGQVWVFIEIGCKVFEL